MLNKQYYVEKAKVDRLVARKNTKADFYNGNYDRYEYPVLTREFAPVHWRYDLDGSWRSGILYRSESVWCRRVHRESGSEAFGQQSKRTDGNHCLYSRCNSYDYFYVE